MMSRREIKRELHEAGEVAAIYLGQGQQPPLYVILIMLGAVRVLRKRRRHPRTVRLGLSIVPVEKRRSPMDPVTVDGSRQNVLCRCAPSDTRGNPTTPTITWQSSDEAVLRLEVAPDTRSALGVTLADGTATVTCHTGSLAEGTPVVSESGTVVVSGIGSPPPPPLPTVALGLTIDPVDKVPVPA